MSDKPEDDKNKEEVIVPIVWGDLEEAPTIYANELIITHAGNEFFLLFGEVFIPIRTVENKDNIPEKINVKPIVKVAITRENMLRFAEAIEGNVEKFVSKQGDKDTE